MKWQDISVFISSTFNDMHAERDFLLKKVFPELSDWCAQRHLRLFDIDLRWGVTSEDSQTKNTVEVCLRNIDQCRPFFLCFLGQRRGWVPEKDDMNPDAFSHYPGLSEHIGKRSVTEMEIEHALLSPMLRMVDGKRFVPEASKYALFFIRDASYLSALNSSQRLIFTNEDALNISQTDRMQAEFIQRVRNKCKNVYDYHCVFDSTLYSNELRKKGDDFAQGRLTDFTVNGQPMDVFIINALKAQILSAFPERCEEEEAQDDGLLQQERKAEDMRRGTALRPQLEQGLDLCVLQSGNRPIFVYGEAGSGKSTLLSRFVSEKKSEFDRICFRFCGATPLTSQWKSLWRTIRKELGLKEDEEAEDSRDLSDVLKKISNTGKTLLVIDGVDELSEGLSALSSIPASLPENVRMILSFRSDSAPSVALIDHLKESGNACLFPINALSDTTEISCLIHTYLQQYLKALDDDQIDLICANPAAANPLYLKVVLRELRFFGSRDQLTDQMTAYGGSPQSAFSKVLEDLEEEVAYHSVHPKLFIPEMMGVLSLVRGSVRITILKSVLVSLTGADEDSVSDTLAYYLRRLGPYLFTDGESIGLLYQSLREAADKRYFQHEAQRHKALAKAYQAANPWECLYHHRKAEDWDKLHELSENFRFLSNGIRQSGALNICEELKSAAAHVNTEVLECLQQTAILIGNNISIAMPLFYKELSSAALRSQVVSLCTAPWLRYEPISLKPPAVSSDTAAFQTEYLSQHLGIQGFCIAPKRNLAFLLSGEAEMAIQDMNTGVSGNTFVLPSLGRVRKVVCTADGKYIAAVSEDLSLRIFRITTDDSLRLLALTLTITDQCSKVRFGGISLFSLPDGILWQRQDGTVACFLEACGEVIEKQQTIDRLVGCFGDLTAWKRNSDSVVCYGNKCISLGARVNDAIENKGRIYLCAENKKIMIIDRETASVWKNFDVPESIVSLTLCGDDIYGADRYGCICRMVDGQTLELLGRISEGDNLIDADTRLFSLNHNRIAFVSLQHSGVIHVGTERQNGRLMKAIQGKNGVHSLWDSGKYFAAALSGGEQYTAAYPEQMLSNHNLNEKNNLKIACSEHILAYENMGNGIRFLLPDGEKVLKCGGLSEMGGLVSHLLFVPEKETFQATTYRAQFWEINEQGELITQIDLPRSESNLYFLCPCGEKSAVLCRRVQARYAPEGSAFIIDVLVMIENRRILWTKEIPRHRDHIAGMLFDKDEDCIVLFYSADRMEKLDIQKGDCVKQQTFPQIQFVSGAAVHNGFLFAVDGEGKESCLTAYALNGDLACRLPAQRRVQQISNATEGVLVLEGNEKLYRVCVETGKNERRCSDGAI